MYQSRYRRPARKPAKRWILLISLLLAAGIAGWFVFLRDTATAPAPAGQTDTADASEQTPAYTAPDLQPVIDAWVAKQTADYHIVVYDHQAKQTIAAHQPGKQLFAASLYKIYVAYLSLVDFQTGAQDPSDILVAGQTKKACVDKMIRSSDSPCGEAMMAEIGQLTLNARVKEMGMTGTIFNGIETSAHDSALILQHILNKRDLKDENTLFLLDAMQDQPDDYEYGLKGGAPEATWQTKVGWNMDINYHDIGIMTTADGRKFAVAILGQGSGSYRPIADFAATIYAALK